MNRKLIIFIKALYQTWIGERPSQLAAGLAYYSIFSAAPLLYISIKIAGVFLDELAVKARFFERVSLVMGDDTAVFLEEMVETVALDASSTSVLVIILGFGALLFAASSLFFYLQYALNAIWKVPPPKRDTTISFIRNRLITFLLVIGVGLFMVSSAVINISLSFIVNLFDFGDWGFLNFVAMISLVTISIAVVYKVLPNIDITWRDVLPGSIVTALLIAGGSWGIGIYLANSRISSAFEAAGTMAVFLISFFFFAQLFLFGAVFTKVFASIFGSGGKDEK